LGQSRVTYLGLVLEKDIRALGENKIHLFLIFPLLKTLKQLRAFLGGGVTGYCRIWIPGYADLTRPYFRSLSKHRRIPSLSLNGMTSQKSAFHQLRKALKIAPALGLQVQDKFQLYVNEKGGLTLGMASQLRVITP
jgi:hypothetical protein